MNKLPDTEKMVQIKREAACPDASWWKCRSQNGFSLVELMTVLAVIGIMSAIAFPGLMKWVPNYRLKAAAQQLYSDVQKAKMTAIKTNRNVTLNLTAPAACPGGSYTFTYVNNAGNVETVASGSMTNGVCLAASPSLDGKQFQSTGLLNGVAGGNAQLSNSAISRTYTVVQAWTGRTRITTP